MTFPRLLFLPAVFVVQIAAAQTLPPGDVQRNIEQSVEQMPSPAARLKPLAPIDVLELGKSQSIQKLARVEIQAELMKEQILDYWRDWIGKFVAAEDIQEFNGWLFDESRRRGYLSYSQTTIRSDQEGETLVVKIMRPRLHAVRIVASDAGLSSQYGKLVLERLQKDLRPGEPLDTLSLDQRLDSASYDLPVELSATIRAAGQELVDLVIRISSATHTSGQFLGSAFQLNNHGLRSFGRPQILAMASWQGYAPKASFSLVAQKSEGVSYARGEYEKVWYGNSHRLRAWASQSDAKNILGGLAASRGNTGELGFGAASIFDGQRDFTFRQYVDLVVRHSHNRLDSSGITVSRVHDQHLRMRTVVDNEKMARDASSIDYRMTLGEYSLLEGISAVEPGNFAKVELGLKHQFSLNHKRSLYSLLRLRSQFSSGRLDSYHQFTLGGVGGVRAYTTVDGVGDNGFQFTAELNKRLDNGMMVGGFYDGGVVKLTQAQSMEYRHGYSLQAVGVQMAGQYQSILYNIHLAKGTGSYRGWAGRLYNTESRPGNWRLSAALTYLY